jgi:hypothetical protein
MQCFSFSHFASVNEESFVACGCKFVIAMTHLDGTDVQILPYLN